MQRRFALAACAVLVVNCHKQNTIPDSPSGSTSSTSAETPPESTAPPAAGPHFVLGPDAWLKHVETQLMPFWMSASALGKTENDPFPTYRCKDGKAFGEVGCDLASGEYKVMSDANATERKVGSPDGTRTDGPYEWLTGPHDELLKRAYVRMHARQTYAYGVAFHLTGKPEYLKLAHRGVKWLLAHAVDQANGSYTFVVDGKAGPEPDFRTSQDQSYTLLGFAFYYYLTRDEAVLKVLTDLKDKVKSRYMSKDWEQGKLIRWMLKTKQEPKPTCFSTLPAPDKGTIEQKELVALLDQVNAYMLLATVSAPPQERDGWLKDLHSMAETIRERFYNDGTKSSDQPHTGVAPVVPAGMFAGCLTYKGPPVPPPGKPFCMKGKNPPPLDPENCDPANHHTDFGHSIKSFWMLYLIGREAEDRAMETFAITGADALFPKAYLDNGTWGRAMKPATPFDAKAPQFQTDRNKEWWIYAELDQMAASMALRDPATHVPRLNTTYPFWLKDFSPDGLEVVQWVYDDCTGSDDACPNRRIPKANLWKNSFHATEHALVAYITTSGVEKKPVTLYYALVGSQLPKLQPYYYRAKAATAEVGPVDDDGTKYRVVRATFVDIR